MNPSSDTVLIAPEYYKLVFFEILKTDSEEIRRKLLHEPSRIRQEEFLEKLPIGKTLSGQEAWDICFEYMSTLETMMQSILKRHSIFFWLHLYRRIGVMLAPEHESATDSHTVGLVRDLVDCAITKFGDAQRHDDAERSSSVKRSQILGGLYQRVLKKHKIDVAAHFKMLRSHPQWVLTKFRRSDYSDIYFVEGLAYEHWRTTALMRSIGKGCKFHRSVENEIKYDDSSDFISLIHSYDVRINLSRLSATLIGAWFDASLEKADPKSILVIPFYNVERIQNLALQAIGVNPNGNALVTNFLLGAFDIERFRDSHQFISAAFAKKAGTTLDAFLRCLAAYATLPLVTPTMLETADENRLK